MFVPLYNVFIHIEFGLITFKYIYLQIIVGNAEAFAQVRDQCGTWYQYMIAWLLYTEPTVKTFDLSFHASKAILAFGQTSLREVDMVIIAILELNLKQVTNHCINLICCLLCVWMKSIM